MSLSEEDDEGAGEVNITVGHLKQCCCLVDKILTIVFLDV